MILGTGVRECQRRGRPPVPEWMQRSGEGARQSASREPRLDRRGAQDVGPALSPRARCECLSGRASDDRNGRSPSVFADDRLRLASVGIAGARMSSSVTTGRRPSQKPRSRPLTRSLPFQCRRPAARDGAVGIETACGSPGARRRPEIPLRCPASGRGLGSARADAAARITLDERGGRRPAPG